MRLIYLLYILLLLFIFSCGDAELPQENSFPEESSLELKIASLTPLSTQVLFELGYGDQIVLRDVTSVTPDAANAIPSAGSRHSFSVEGVLGHSPNCVIAHKESISEEFISQIENAGVQVIQILKPTSSEEAKMAIADLLGQLGIGSESDMLTSMYDCDEVVDSTGQRCLFVYARSGGSLLVGGANTPVAEMIRMGGGEYVATDVEGFKPLATEALVKYDPQVIVMFDHGFEAMGSIDQITGIPGMSETSAGKTGTVIHMPAHALNGFGLNYCEDLKQLNQLLKSTL